MKIETLSEPGIDIVNIITIDCGKEQMITLSRLSGDFNHIHITEELNDGWYQWRKDFRVPVVASEVINALSKLNKNLDCDEVYTKVCDFINSSNA